MTELITGIEGFKIPLVCHSEDPDGCREKRNLKCDYDFIYIQDYSQPDTSSSLFLPAFIIRMTQDFDKGH